MTLVQPVREVDLYSYRRGEASRDNYIAQLERKVADAEKLEEIRGRTMDWDRVRKFISRRKASEEKG